MTIMLKVLNISDQDPVSAELEFTMKNDTTNQYEVLTWGTPFEGEFNDNMFDVTKDGESLPYLGRQFKQMNPDDTKDDGAHKEETLQVE